MAGLGSYSTTNQNMGEGSIVNNIIKMQPVVAVYDIDGYFGGAKANTLGNGTNPVKQAYTAKDNVDTQNSIVGNVYATLEILDGLPNFFDPECSIAFIAFQIEI